MACPWEAQAVFAGKAALTASCRGFVAEMMTRYRYSVQADACWSGGCLLRDTWLSPTIRLVLNYPTVERIVAKGQ